MLATDQGLGYLAKAFYDHGIISKVFIKEHSSRANHREWYTRESIVSAPELLLEECDTILFFEEAFYWKLIPAAREKGIKTVLMPMYECTRNPMPYEPDVIIAPSLLDLKYYADKNTTFLTVPVEVEWKLRTHARHFVHNAGNGGLGGRNGTKELLEAMQYVKSPITLTVRSQVPLKAPDDARVKVEVGTVPYAQLWAEGDVFIFPEKFNGLSLPLQEAYAAGMLVMTSDRVPNNTWLPKAPLIPVDHYTKERIAIEFDCAQFDPKAIAATIDAWYDKPITQYSLQGKKWGEQNSWHNLKDKYLAVL